MKIRLDGIMFKTKVTLEVLRSMILQIENINTQIQNSNFPIHIVFQYSSDIFPRNKIKKLGVNAVRKVKDKFRVQFELKHNLAVKQRLSLKHSE